MTSLQTQIELLKINTFDLLLTGEWLTTSIPKWKGRIEYAEPLFSISFLQYGTSIHWVKSDNLRTNGHSIRISLFNDNNLNLNVQFSCNFNNSINYIWTSVASLNERPKIYNHCSTGHICLIAEMKSNPTIKLYAIFIPFSIIKVGRNGLWHVRDEYLESVPNNYKQILRYNRTGDFAITDLL